VTSADPTPPFQVTVDCADPPRMARFWAGVLGYVPQPPPPGFDSWTAFARSAGLSDAEMQNVAALVDPAGVAPRMLLLKVPEPKTSKNRMHLDVNVRLTGAQAGLSGDGRRAAIRAMARGLVADGATLIGERHDEVSWWITLLDPEGNEFCLQ
jgi:Glyoxalase-like domain